MHSHHHSILTDVQNLMGTWGYPMLFGLLFSCGLGVPLPEDIPLLLGGYFVANGKMNLALAAISAWCGILAGDCMLYTFGRRYGMAITRLPLVGKEVTPGRIQWVQAHFRKNGVWFVGVGRMFAGIRGAMVVTAGITHFPFIPFIIVDGLAAIVSGGLFVSLGYWAGKKLGDLDALREKIGHYEREVVFFGAAGLAILGLVVWYRHDRAKSIEAVLPGQALALNSLPNDEKEDDEVPPPPS
jgi:membrane protein DedA with SNARE-associated domain